MKKVLIASGVAVLALAMVAGAQASTFVSNLSVGSSGPEVVALQKLLIAEGFSIPAVQSGAAQYGYFGSQTKAAVVKYQEAKGIVNPGTGFVGPLTKKVLNGGAVVVAPTSCPVGMICTPIGGGTTGGTVVSGITTPGVEGTLTVTSAPVSGSTVYEGSTMVPVLAFKAAAKSSDIVLQRVKLDLGTNSKIYNKIYSKIYVVNDAGQTLASSDLNSSTVVKESTTYYLSLTGLNYVVAKDATKTITIKADVRPTIDTGDLGAYTVQLANDGVRGTDGAGIAQYSPSTGSSVSKAITVSGSLIDSAQLTLSTNTASPLTASMVASSGSGSDELDNLSLLTFDVKADKDDVKMTDLVVTVTSTGPATASTTKLYEGSTLIDTASQSMSTATFSDLDIVIAKGTTKTFTIKVDVRGATTAATTIAASLTNANITAENSIADAVTSKSGSATGANMIVRKAGPEFTLVGTNVSKNTSTNNNYSTTSVSVTFNVRVKAVGDAVRFGTQAASTTFTFGIYQNGTKTAQLVASSTAFDIPDNANTVGLLATDAFEVPRDQEVLVPVTFTFDNRTAAGVLLSSVNTYKVGLEAINWTNATSPLSVQSSTFMSGQNAWRSATVLP